MPILEPHSEDLHERIHYEGGIFKCVNDGDKEAENLIDFLGFNKYEVSEDRRRHISRIKQLRLWKTEPEFFDYLKEHRQELSYATALEKELGYSITPARFPQFMGALGAALQASEYVK